MGTMPRKPFFCVVLGDGERWSVEAEWSDGTIEQIDTFRRHFEAVNWVNNRSEAWLQERTCDPLRALSTPAAPSRQTQREGE